MEETSRSPVKDLGSIKCFPRICNVFYHVLPTASAVTVYISMLTNRFMSSCN